MTSIPPIDPAAVRRTRGHITNYGDGRTCAASECDANLSRYNKAELCWTHAEKRELERRTRMA